MLSHTISLDDKSFADTTASHYYYTNTLEQKDNSVISSKEVFLGKFNKFLKFHKINVKDFWTHSSVELKLSEFYKLVEQKGYSLTLEQKFYLSTILSEDNQKIHLNALTKIKVWEDAKMQIMRLINQNSLKLLQSTKKDGLNEKKQQEHTKKLYQSIKRMTQYQKQLPKTSNITNWKERSKIQSRDLNSRIKKNQSQNKFDLLVKMGEANTILKRQTTQAHFQVQNTNGFKIKEINEFGQGSLISYSDFNRKYKHIERREKRKSETKEIKKNCKSNFKGTLLLVLQEHDQVTKQKLNQRVKQRDNELKLILLQTARLKLIMKEQCQILQKKGINT